MIMNQRWSEVPSVVTEYRPEKSHLGETHVSRQPTPSLVTLRREIVLGLLYPVAWQRRRAAPRRRRSPAPRRRRRPPANRAVPMGLGNSLLNPSLDRDPNVHSLELGTSLELADLDALKAALQTYKSLVTPFAQQLLIMLMPDMSLPI